MARLIGSRTLFRPRTALPMAMARLNHDWLTKKRTAIAVALLLALRAALVAYSATLHSPTNMEPALLASGISHWRLGRFDLYRVNPPLVKMVAAVPVMMAGCETDWARLHVFPGSRAEYSIGDDFVRANGARSIWLIIIARWACIPFGLLGGWFTWRWASELYGGLPGLVALAVWCFDPNLLAHAELITPDTACVSFGIAAGFQFWKWLRQPTLFRANVAGFWLGAALLAKMTWLVLFLIWPPVWLVWTAAAIHCPRSSACDLSQAAKDNAASTQSTAIRPPLMHLAVIFLLAIYIVNLGYGLDGVFTRIDRFTFVSKLLTGNDKAGDLGNRFRGTVLGAVPSVFPKQYVLGFDAQKRDFEDYGRPGYLLGQWSRTGWWYYYLVGLMVKTPCGTLTLFSCAVFAWIIGSRKTTGLLDEFALLAPAVAIAVLVSSQRGINDHLRYIFPAFGLAVVFLGRAFARAGERGWLARAVPLAAVCFSIMSTIAAYPHHLAYFNEFVGGPRNGHHYLLGSSLDWGQDLLLLRDWERANAARVTSYIGGPEFTVFRALHSNSPSVQSSTRSVRIASSNRLFSDDSRLKPTGERVGFTLWVVE